MALWVGLRSAAYTRSKTKGARLMEAALAGGLFGLLQGVLWLLSLMMFIIITPAAFAQRDKDPTGKEIADQSTATKLDKSLTVRTTQGARSAQVTPVIAGNITGTGDLETVRIVGVLESHGNVGSVPDGTHNIFIAKVNDVWQAYVESGGKIVAQSKNVMVEDGNGATKKAEIFLGPIIIIIRRGGTTIIIIIRGH